MGQLVERVAVGFYHFDYQQAPQWPVPMRSYFTKRALSELHESLKDGLIGDVEEHHFKVTARLVEPVEVRGEGVSQWQAKCVIQVHYDNAHEHFQRDLQINLRLVPGGEHGMLVDQLVSRQARCVTPDKMWL